MSPGRSHPAVRQARIDDLPDGAGLNGWRLRNLQIAAVLVVTGVAAVGVAIIARERLGRAGTPVRIGPVPALAPVPAIPVLAAGYWLVMRIIRRGMHDDWERARRR